jgi:hypothetical protein
MDGWREGGRVSSSPASVVILIYAIFAMGIFVFTDMLLLYLTNRVIGKNTKIRYLKYQI